MRDKVGFGPILYNIYANKQRTPILTPTYPEEAMFGSSSHFWFLQFWSLDKPFLTLPLLSLPPGILLPTDTASNLS